jgi:surface protein
MGTEKHLDLSDIELDESITNLSNLFKDKQIKSIDVCGWNVNNVLNFTNMFCGCDKLKCIDGLIDWEVTSAVNFYKMFYGCASLTEVHGLTDWDVSGITTFGYMFYGCESLELKLNKWKISDGASTYNMTKKSKVSIF